MRNAKTSPAGWIPFMRSLARDAGLKVVIGGNPATDGKTIWLPALPAELTEDDLVVFKGDGYHEVGHIQRSNIKFFQAFGREHGSFASFLLNALDDVFMEGRQAAWKKTAGRYLLDSTMVLIKRNRFRDGSAGLGEAVGCYCLTYLTAKRWPSVGVAADRVEVNLRKHLAQHADTVIPALRNLLDAEFPSVASTEDGGALALKIIDLMKSLSEQDQSQADPSPESGDDDGDDGEGPDDSEPNPSNDPSETGNSQPAGDEDDAEPNSKGNHNADEPDSDPQGDEQGKDGDADPEQKSEGKGSGAGDADETESESDPKGKGEGAAEGESQDAGSNGGKGDKAGDDQGDKETSGDSSDGSQAPEESGKSLSQMIDDMLNEEPGDQEVFDKGAATKELAASIAGGANDDYKDKPLINGLVFDYSNGTSEAEGFVDGMPVVEPDRAMATAIQAVTGRKANVMGNRLRALLANREETDEYSARNGRLCEQNLHRFALNDSRIFAKADELVADSAAVSITADLSISTNFGGDVNTTVAGQTPDASDDADDAKASKASKASKAKLIPKTTVAEQIRVALTIIENVLHQIGTPREILGFAPKSGEVNCMVKSFQDDHRVAVDRIAGMHKLVGGWSTPIGAAVMQAGARLMSHDAQRKLLLVVTDGMPSDKAQALEMTNLVLRNGIQVIYLVIGAESSCDWLKEANIKFAYAENAEGVVPAMVDKMAEFLM
ncbi:hypothetical protein NPS53_08525 [Pseudomonas putida]|uniref:hypothetical protein n=1 Tax=Pseudomonas putida TaxID=303 RepID=UPI002363F0DA|nr:hypothetical protein [Pseudomonas putida]MDD2139617.1 hypothetical protein [Pseudomonas putida]HDS1721540.1 hypothetical protein [Pseudomonas putida]